ncbi:hypothetical protein OESDEN_09285 [Oesophagostomum dentatum]|uniref:Uncharacterized protein n=1 Tax=Oesophagostomum dentatum TaxID=61180 RepID=A0A0B1T4X7_OESDE|nr:hypothetical protein OESDEN_09285 [Oesophagostomum dentatum]
MMLTSLGVSQLIVQSLMAYLPAPISQVLIVIMCAFSHEWNWVHGEALTRHRRAYLNVANVLETYQPRARTEGHLFQPEPPTPGYLAVVEKKEEGKDENQNEFMNARDAHYAGMYTHAVQMNKEMDLMNKVIAQ